RQSNSDNLLHDLSPFLKLVCVSVATLCFSFSFLRLGFLELQPCCQVGAGGNPAIFGGRATSPEGPSIRAIPVAEIFRVDATACSRRGGRRSISYPIGSGGYPFG
ncbi:MAG TPA: hypothetical protein VFA98_01595, partial [Thermoanaerobaculia bacterium]|nr:hypothetical protein [Thermoanaerobaculia bacterium]